ncbi:MAG: hypothetical protein KGI80_03940 [Verrucomicrobiota bacterium]|nr:hypothetical protein [Verrucomicrobiota bacterium]
MATYYAAMGEVAAQNDAYNTDYQTAVNALADIQTQYNALLAVIQKYTDNTAQIWNRNKNDQTIFTGFDWKDAQWSINSIFNNIVADINTIQNCGIASATTLGSLSQLHDAFSGLYQTLSTPKVNSKEKFLSPSQMKSFHTNRWSANFVSSYLNAGDVSLYETDITSAFGILGSELQSDLDTAELNVLPNTPEYTQMRAAYSQDLIKQATAIQSDLNILMSQLQAMVNEYATQLQQAQYDHFQAQARITKSQGFDSNAYRKRNCANARIRRLHSFLENVTAVASSLSSSIGAEQPQFLQMQLVFDLLKMQVSKLLSTPNLSPTQQASALLGILLVLLGYMDTIKQFLEETKAKNEKDVSKANSSCSQLNLDHYAKNQKMMAEVKNLEKYAKQMKAVQIAMAVVMAVGFIAFSAVTCGAGATVAIAALSMLDVLNQTGVIKFDPAQMLANHSNGKLNTLDATLIITLLEVILCAAGGAALDSLASSSGEGMAAEGEDAAVVKVAPLLVDGGAGGVDAGVKDSGDVAMKEAVSVNAGDSTAEEVDSIDLQAVKTLIKQSVGRTSGRLFVQSEKAINLLERILNGGMRSQVKKDVDVALQKFVDEQEADVKVLLQKIAKGNQAEQKAAKDDLNTLVKNFLQGLAKQPRDGEGFIGAIRARFGESTATGVKRILTSSVYLTAQNNVYTQLVEKILQANGDSSGSKEYQAWTTIVQLLEGFLSMAVLGANSGMAEASKLARGLTSLSAVTSGLGMGGESANSLYENVVYSVEGSTTYSNATVDLESNFLDLLSKLLANATSSNKGNQAEIAQSMKHTWDLAEHALDGRIAGSRVLAAASI